MQNRMIDIDGTICEDIANENSHLYPLATPNIEWREKIKRWYDNGDCVVFFTAREEKDRMVTLKWLDSHGFRYHKLIMEKPRGGNIRVYDNLPGQWIHFTGNVSEME